ncbi:MAG: hypothetical protein KatS3mg010_0592 [Acidimicrobiia bacterium]|nr:MAG: hypothetical protein KatS3mg010_0592 [Acidimicrobiia bacterium]
MRALVTGGAGFIGSHLVDALVERGAEVRVIDDFFTGLRENLNPAVDLYEGTVADEELVRRAVGGCEVVFHQAAHKAVLRSVEHPLPTDLANTHGTLTVLEAAKDAGVRRVVYASSSSVYGGAAAVPTPEDAPTVPRSPYAVSKLAGEHYCRVFTELYGLETVTLRYFNVYGPRQRPDGAYAAVIPLFVRALLDGSRPVVHGDGGQARDFTYVDDVVEANLRAAAAPGDRCAGTCTTSRAVSRPPCSTSSRPSRASSASKRTRSSRRRERATSVAAAAMRAPRRAIWTFGARSTSRPGSGTRSMRSVDTVDDAGNCALLADSGV